MLIHKEDSFAKRYATKFLTSVLGIFLSTISAGIVPRSLGPKHYGDYSFLTNIFSQVIDFLDMKASTCLYVKLSRNQKDLLIIRFYSLFTILIILILVIGTWCITSNQVLLNAFLPAQQIRFVYLAVIFAITLFIHQKFANIMDAFGATVFSEKINFLLRAIGVLLVLIFFMFKTLDLYLYFYINIATSLAFVLIILFYLKKVSFAPITDLKLIKNYTKVFYQYCAPLVVYMIIGLLSGYFDRWILQKYGGSVQQGYYTFAFNISSMSLFAVSTMYLLFTRDLSVLIGKNDINAAAKLFDKYVPSLYVIVAYFSCFLFFQADNVINIFAGRDYKGASLTLKILSMYPLVSTFSMMSGAVIYATGRTVIYRNLSFVFAPLGALVNILLISPIAGISMGAAGLGIATISIEFIGVVIVFYLNSRYLKISFRKYLFHMIYIPAIFLACAGAASCFVNLSYFKHIGVLFSILIPGMIYSITFITIIFLYPKLVFKERHEIIDFVKVLRSKIVLPWNSK